MRGFVLHSDYCSSSLALKLSYSERCVLAILMDSIPRFTSLVTLVIPSFILPTGYRFFVSRHIQTSELPKDNFRFSWFIRCNTEIRLSEDEKMVIRRIETRRRRGKWKNSGGEADRAANTIEKHKMWTIEVEDRGIGSITTFVYCERGVDKKKFYDTSFLLEGGQALEMAVPSLDAASSDATVVADSQ